MTPKAIAIQTAWSYLGRPYLWGGDDPVAGLDCSGFVIESLKASGRLPRSGDWTAQGLHDVFKSVSEPREGCLVFWAGGGRIIHVELCLDERFQSARPAAAATR